MGSILKNGIFGLLLVFILAAALSFLAGIRPAYVKSGSMEPTIPVGSICLMNTRADRQVIQKGDVIAFTIGPNRSPVTHRVVEVTDDGYRTKGDANEEPDPWHIAPENVTGTVIGSVPYLGYAVAFLQSRNGILLLVGLAGAYIGCQIYRKGTRREERPEEQEE